MEIGTWVTTDIMSAIDGMCHALLSDESVVKRIGTRRCGYTGWHIGAQCVPQPWGEEWRLVGRRSEPGQMTRPPLLLITEVAAAASLKEQANLLAALCWLAEEMR